MAEASPNTILDSGLQYLGSVYAKALLGAAEKALGSAGVDQVVAELEAVSDQVFARLPRLTATLGSPKVALASKEQMLDKALGGKIAPVLLVALKVLARRGRFDCLPAMRLAARRQLNALRGLVEATVTTAGAVDGPTREALVAKLGRALRAQVSVQYRVDPQILGGVVVQVGDTVYDGSLANQLTRLRSQLVASATSQLRGEMGRFATSQ